MGQIVGAAIVSHHPGLMQTEAFRKEMGGGSDSDLIAGYARLRERIASVAPDVAIIFDSHWFTTGYHLIDAGAHYEGTYVSDEMPWYLNGLRYRYDGHPALAQAIDAVAKERAVASKAVDHPHLERQYATLNVIAHLALDDTPIVTVSSCQNCEPRHYLQSGEVIGEAIKRSGLRVLLLASGALSHKFNNIDWTPKHPRLFHEDNVSRPENVASDKGAVERFRQGQHDVILERWDEDYRQIPWEGFGAHYLQMVGALGGRACRLKGEPLSAYENARGTGNIHVWFDVLGEPRA